MGSILEGPTEQPSVEALLLAEPASQKDKALESLEEELERLKERSREERFCWIAIVIVLFDAGVFPHFKTWGGPVALMLIELVPLIVIARRFGVQEFIRILDSVIASYGQRSPSNGKLG